MTLAEGWRDYVLLDAGDGEKLELWGDVKVVRPDPQAFWPRSYKWETPDMYYHRSRSGGGTWEILSKNTPATWQISYNNLRFHIRPTGFKHMGLFPEQAVNWQWLNKVLGGKLFLEKKSFPPNPLSKKSNLDAGQLCEECDPSNVRGQGVWPDESRRLKEPFPPLAGSLPHPCRGIGDSVPKVLNLFAYTGGATVACLAAGAEVTHIDAAKGMNAQAKENIALSGLSGAKHRVLADDVLKFVKREIRRGNMYDGIIMDPPVFGRGPGGEMWRLEENLAELVETCMELLSPTARFFLINAYTAGLSPTAYGNILQRCARRTADTVGASASAPMLSKPEARRGEVSVDARRTADTVEASANAPMFSKPEANQGEVSVGEIGIRARSGIILPCGMYARMVWKD